MINHQEKVRLHIVLDNIRSAFNVGSIFRSADATGTAKIYLCGITPNLENPKLSKTALGALESVESEYFTDTQHALDKIESENVPIYGIELSEESKHFQKTEYPNEVALVFGHEINGVNQLVMDRCEKLVYIPMNGIKESLNVANTASILMFEAIRHDRIAA